MMANLKIETMPIGDLTPYHRNPRRGNMAAIAESLKARGQYKPIVVNKGTHTGRPMEVLAGNHTLKAARKLGWETITCHLIDVDDDQAARIVLADNKTAEYGSYDDTTLTDLLKTLNDLDGTGWTEEQVDALNDLDEPLDSGIEENYAERFELVIECRSEQHQEELFQRLTNEGETCRLLTL